MSGRNRCGQRVKTWWQARLEVWEPRVREWKDRFDALAGKYPRTNRIVVYAIAADTLDMCLVLAAQALLLMVPMLIVFATVLPRTLRGHAVGTVNELFGTHGASAAQVSSVFAGNGASRASFGVVGLLLALASATSLTRRLQRIFERLWKLPPGTMWASAHRWLLWLLAWVGSLLVQGYLRSSGGGLAVLGWTLSAVFAVGLWWWTPHLLMLGRIGWRALLPTALVLGLGATVLEIATRLLLPAVLNNSVHEYGPTGMVLTFMSWLVAISGVVVIGAGIGRVLGAPE